VQSIETGDEKAAIDMIKHKTTDCRVTELRSSTEESLKVTIHLIQSNHVTSTNFLNDRGHRLEWVW
jgi:hypothetical protein